MIEKACDAGGHVVDIEADILVVPCMLSHERSGDRSRAGRKELVDERVGRSGVWVGEVNRRRRPTRKREPRDQRARAGKISTNQSLSSLKSTFLICSSPPCKFDAGLLPEPLTLADMRTPSWSWFASLAWRALHLLDLGGDTAGNGISKLFLTIAAAFAEAERDRIRERIGQAKADQKARGRFLGGDVPFGFGVGADGALVPMGAQQEAIREIAALRAQGRSLRAIRDEMRANGFQISHAGVARILKGRRAV